MRSLIPAVLVFLVPILTAQTPNWQALKQGIVKVDASWGSGRQTGTGFVVAVTNGAVRIVTARHVVVNEQSETASGVLVTFVSDPVTSIPATVMHLRSDTLDLAVLEVHAPPTAALPKNFPRFAWLPDTSLQVTGHIWTMDGGWNPVPNTITRLDSSYDPRKFQSTAVTVTDGFSGAPVFDDYGHLVGIHDATSGTYAVAIKIGSAFAALDALGYNIEASLGQPTALTARTAAPAPRPTQAKPPVWRNLVNNQLYSLQAAGDRFYIRQNNNVVADLVLTKDKKGAERFTGQGPLSNCPGGAGYIEIYSVTEQRVEGRVEQAVNNNGKQMCGGVFGVMRSMTKLAFIPE